MTTTSRRRRLTDERVRKLKPPSSGRLTVPDPEMIGLYVRVTHLGARSYAAVARDPYGKQIWTTFGSCDHVSIDDARAKAREAIRRVRAGLTAIEPAPPAPQSFQAVAEGWLKRHVEKNKLRSAAEIRRSLTKYVYPHLGHLDIGAIRKSDIVRLLDHVEDEHGARTADAVLALVSGVMNWHSARTDDFVVPLSRGMRRTSTKERARKRVLGDDELRAVWRLAEKSGAFGGIVQLALLTGQRRAKVCTMKWADVSVNGIWSIHVEPREKGCGGDLVLPEAALRIIRAQPRIEGNPFVFAGRGDRYLAGGLAKQKRRFDAELPPMPAWVLHDLRRSARSLMSRAGVRPDISERVLGHVQPGVLGVYDRHEYATEKRDALQRLASLLETIINPPTDNVLPIRKVHVDA